MPLDALELAARCCSPIVPLVTIMTPERTAAASLIINAAPALIAEIRRLRAALTDTWRVLYSSDDGMAEPPADIEHVAEDVIRGARETLSVNDELRAENRTLRNAAVTLDAENERLREVEAAARTTVSGHSDLCPCDACLVARNRALRAALAKGGA